MTTELLSIAVQRFSMIMSETDPDFDGASIQVEPYSGGPIELALTINYKSKGAVTIVTEENEIVTYMNMAITGQL